MRRQPCRNGDGGASSVAVLIRYDQEGLVVLSLCGLSSLFTKCSIASFAGKFDLVGIACTAFPVLGPFQPRVNHMLATVLGFVTFC
jgi:hypothetical protein